LPSSIIRLKKIFIISSFRIGEAVAQSSKKETGAISLTIPFIK
jgi:hypothetical protein